MSRGAARRGAARRRENFFFLLNFFYYFFYYEKYILNKRKLFPIFNFAISAPCESMLHLTVNLCSAVEQIPDVIAKWNFDTSLQLGWSLFLYHFSILIRKQKNYLCWAVAINLWNFYFFCFSYKMLHDISLSFSGIITTNMYILFYQFQPHRIISSQMSTFHPAWPHQPTWGWNCQIKYGRWFFVV